MNLLIYNDFWSHTTPQYVYQVKATVLELLNQWLLNKIRVIWRMSRILLEIKTGYFSRPHRLTTVFYMEFIYFLVCTFLLVIFLFIYFVLCCYFVYSLFFFFGFGFCGLFSFLFIFVCFVLCPMLLCFWIVHSWLPLLYFIIYIKALNCFKVMKLLVSKLSFSLYFIFY